MAENRCAKNILIPGMWPRKKQCSRKAGPSGYCSQHDPESVKKRLLERDAQWERKRVVRNKQWALETAAPELLWSLERVLDALGALSNPSELSGHAITSDWSQDDRT
jgi:hypothetical protein